MSGHTPGPWTSGKNARGGWGVWATPLMYGVLDDSAPGIDAKANATLIASAPELLSVLRDIVNAVSPGSGKHFDRGLFDLLEDARSTIARAEGREVRP